MAKPAKLEQLLNNGIGTFESKVTYRSGYILNAFENNKKFDAMIVPVNCHNACGVGILKAVADKYPEAFAQLNLTSKGDQSKMGNLLVVDLANGKKLIYVFCSIGYNKATVPKRMWDRPGVNLKSLRIALKSALTNYCDNPCIPTFGMGMFPTPWSTIEGVFDDVLDTFPDKTKSITVFK
jgi:hypothetical protein